MPKREWAGFLDRRPYREAMPLPQRRFIPLGDGGIYTVSEVCRILQPSMTPRKIHYWINTGLLTPPLVHHRGAGIPTLLTFRQLLEVRTVQRIRDELSFQLKAVRSAFSWILQTAFSDDVTELVFDRGPHGTLLARSGEHELVVPGGQGVIPGVLADLNDTLGQVMMAYRVGWFHVPGHQNVVCNVAVLGGTACLRDTRLDTALIGAFAQGGAFDDQTIYEVQAAYPRLSVAAIADALSFEGASSCRQREVPAR